MRVLLPLLLIACKPVIPTQTDDLPTDPPTDTCDQPLSCTLGTGEDGFEPITGPLTLVHGPQGGWHLVLALDLQGSTPVVRGRAEVLDGEVLLAGSQGLRDTATLLTVFDEATCTGEAVGFNALIDDLSPQMADICALAGRPLTVTVFVEDQEEQSTSCSATVQTTLDPDDVFECSSD